MVEGMLDTEKEKEKAKCVVSPHAGFEYSGPVAGAVFSSVQLPGKFVILGPSHRPIQSRVAIMKQGIWETPLGNVKIDSSLAELIMMHSHLIEEDESAHMDEHSLEVQLPFIQYMRKDAEIVPMCLSYHISFEELEELGQAIAKGIKRGTRTRFAAGIDMLDIGPSQIGNRREIGPGDLWPKIGMHVG